MTNRIKSAILFSLLALTAIIISACEKPYSNPPLETATVFPTNLFVSPIATSDNPIDMIGEYATGTAMAKAEAALTAGTPPATESPGTGTSATETSEIEITPDSNVTQPATTSGTPAPDDVTPTATQPLPTVTINRPSSYTLQKGEFPYCIARRFNVDPSELLNLNNLSNGDVYYPNLTLTIPQTGNPFPYTRARNIHPDTYTVESSDSTIYAVACYYGDIDPAAIAQANNLQLTSVLTVGQQLTIP